MARPREFDKDRLHAVALDLFWSAGYERTTMSQISAKSGVSNGSMFAAYGSKLGLFMSVFAPYCESRVDIVDTAMASGATEIDSVREFLRVVIDDCANQPARRGCLLLNSIAEFGEGETVVLDLAERTNRDMVGSIARRIATAPFARGTDAIALATQILLVSQGLIASSRARMAQHELAEVADTYCDMLASA